jgi:hypothetical protein
MTTAMADVDRKKLDRGQATVLADPAARCTSVATTATRPRLSSVRSRPCSCTGWRPLRSRCGGGGRSLTGVPAGHLSKSGPLTIFASAVEQQPAVDLALPRRAGVAAGQ